MNEEILSGLKIALERGFQLDESVQSFINAGYNASEVKESASFLSKGFSPLPSLPKEEVISKEETKFGLRFEDAEEILHSQELQQMRNIRIAGLMGMATLKIGRAHV